MKQKAIYIVLMIVCMYFPASSEECAGAFAPVAPVTGLELVDKPVLAAEPVSSLPVSLFSKLVFKM